MGWSALRGMVAGVLAILCPFSLLAADTGAAMLYTSGAAWVNGAHVPYSASAILAGDVVQTRSDSLANINQPGSTVMVLADSLVKFEVASLDVIHGSATVSTSRETALTAGDIKVTPVSSAWTEFNVTHLNGAVRIAARKGDLSVSNGKETVTLAQGQETTRDESSSASKDGKKKSQKPTTGAVPAAHGGTLNSPIAVGVGGAAVGALTVWILAFHDDEPVSPDRP